MGWRGLEEYNRIAEKFVGIIILIMNGLDFVMNVSWEFLFSCLLETRGPFVFE